MRTILAIIVMLLGAGAVLYFQSRAPGGPGPDTDTDVLVPAESVSAPTNFNEVGVLHFPPVTSGQSEGTFEFNDGTGTGTTLAIDMDALSVCATGDGATPCMAMSITFDKPFDGKTALVEGIRTDDRILVRKLRIARDGEELRSFEPGNIFISWPAAVALIDACQVAMATQTHALDVYLTLKGGGEVRAVEPTIDTMFGVIQGASARCGTYPVGTE